MGSVDAINRVGELVEELRQRAAAVEAAAASVSERWKALTRVGGARPDHAAELMGAELAPPLGELSAFAAACCQQLEQLRANPFVD